MLKSFTGYFLPALQSNQMRSAAIALSLSFCVFHAPAFAEMKQVRSTLRPTQDQTFSDLMKQAERVAEKLVRQTFAQNPKVTDVSVTVLGERNGQETPLLLSTVSRTNWQKKPQIKSWTTYFNNFSIALLGYRKPPVPPAPVAPPPVAVNPDLPPSPQPNATGTTPAIAPSVPTPVRPSVVPTSLSPGRAGLQNDPAYRDD